MNNYGGSEATTHLMEVAKKELPLGKKKLFKNKTYKGSMLFYQIERFANILCTSKLSDFKDTHGESLEYIAYSNHIKCSPDNRKSKVNPSKKMWENCGNHILSHEIEILKPKYLFILGESNNFHYLNKLYNWKAKKIKQEGDVSKYLLSTKEGNIECFVFSSPRCS